MTRQLQHAVFAAGLGVVAWVAAGYAAQLPTTPSHSLLALAVTLTIGAAYLAGALELRRFRAATEGLARVVAGPAPTADLGPWLQQLPVALRHAVRLRIEGERVALPGAQLAPYLTGLLVLLGMLGTFLGMVVTLNGTGLALDSATDLAAVRASLSAPVKGLGLAFGTSVAGVAASAMLGLLSALCRRERQQAVQALDGLVAGPLRVFSLAHQRDESFRLLQQQAAAMPVLVDRLQALMAGLQQQGDTLGARLADEQARFHGQAGLAYAGLAESVGRSLDSSLTASARIAGATLQPVAEATMAAIAQETATLRDTLAQGLQQQMDALSTRLEAAQARMADGWQQAMAEQQHRSAQLAADWQARLDGFQSGFEQRSAALVDDLGRRLSGAAEGATARFGEQATALVQSVDRAHAGLQAGLAEGDAQRLAAWTARLDANAATLQQGFDRASTRLLAEMAALLASAAEAPKAAAEVIGELRDRLSQSLAHDNRLLDERNRLLQTLGTLLDALEHASSGQRTAIDTLVADSAAMLERIGQRFAGTTEAQAERLAEASTQAAGSAVEVASLGEAFGTAVQLFSESNDKLGAQLQRIEAALAKSMARSDEQLAYYVAQAREVIDLSILSQKQILEDLQQLGRLPQGPAQRAVAATEA